MLSEEHLKNATKEKSKYNKYNYLLIFYHVLFKYFSVHISILDGIVLKILFYSILFYLAI